MGRARMSLRDRVRAFSTTIPAALGLMALASGCSPAVSDPRAQAAQARATHPVSGLALITVTVTSANGEHRFRTELASTRFEQAKGLMFRTAMGEDEAMLFPLEPPRPADFWMKNTVIPLDIVFIGRNRRILNIAANTVPYSEDAILSDGAAAAVLELVGGRAAQLGIAAGDKVHW
jgi:uncharacterized protein